MTVLQNTKDLPEQRSPRVWIRRLLIMIALGGAAYYSYCFGLWGRDSLLPQYLFQCGCPKFSDEWRYPKEVDVLVSACGYADLMVSPGGRLLYVEQERFGFSSAYLMDLKTKERTRFVRPDLPEGYFSFLNDEFMYISEHVLDLTTNMLYPLRKFSYSDPRGGPYGDFDPAKLAFALQQADDVYFIERGDLIVALDSDFPASSENSFLSGWFDIPGSETDREEKFLQAHNITYQVISSGYIREAFSPDRKFVARSDGIYLVSTDQLIVESADFGLRGWAYDSRGAIYTAKSCLWLFSLPGLDMTCLISVRQPVIKLKVPEEYLSPTQVP